MTLIQLDCYADYYYSERNGPVPIETKQYFLKHMQFDQGERFNYQQINKWDQVIKVNQELSNPCREIQKSVQKI